MARKRTSWLNPCIRWWATLNGTVVRFLQVDRYDRYGNHRCYLRLLPNNDPRPQGIHMKGIHPHTLEQFAAIPRGCWCELTFPLASV